MATWTCGCCGEEHESLPDSFAFGEPFQWNLAWNDSLPENCYLDTDYCMIESRDYFIRATLEIPVEGRETPFVFGVWSSLSEVNYDRALTMADDPARVNEPAYFGWLSNRIWQYPDTLNLKCRVISRELGIRPYLELEPTDHPLSVELRNGISFARFVELSTQCLHGWSHPESQAHRG